MTPAGPAVRLAAGAILLVSACGAPDEATSEGDRPTVVVRSDGTSAPPSVTAREGTNVGPDAAPEIVILPEDRPETRARVVYQTVYADPPVAPSPAGSDADLTGGGAALPAPRPGGSAEVILPAERTQVRANASVTLSTDESRVGDAVSARTVEPILVDGEEVVPAGSTIHGRVSEVDRGEYPVRRPSMEIVWDRIETPDGRTVEIDARTAGEVGTVVQHPRGDHSSMRNILLGAGAGAAVGGATGGKRGAAVGAIAGAAIGAGVGHGGVDWCAVVHPGDSMIIIFNRDAVLRRGPAGTFLTGR